MNRVLKKRMLYLFRHTKRGTAGGALPSHLLVWHCLLICNMHLSYRSYSTVLQMAYTKRRIGGAPAANPSFCMTLTKILKDTFLRHTAHIIFKKNQFSCSLGTIRSRHLDYLIEILCACRVHGHCREFQSYTQIIWFCTKIPPQSGPVVPHGKSGDKYYRYDIVKIQPFRTHLSTYMYTKSLSTDWLHQQRFTWRLRKMQTFHPRSGYILWTYNIHRTSNA